MKLGASKLGMLVFAHIPPPHHGQSVMVESMIRGLKGSSVVLVRHVNARVSTDLADLGGFRLRKITALLGHCLAAITLRIRHGKMDLYYVPAPAKKSAILRDLFALSLLRPFFPDLILHWHAVGLGTWARGESPRIFKPAVDAFMRRWIKNLLAGARLSIVLTESNRDDCAVFEPHRIACIPNGLEDPCPGFDESTPNHRRDENLFRCLYLAHCTLQKGLFLTLDAILKANEILKEQGSPTRISLSVCGAFADEKTRQEFQARTIGIPESAVRYLGFISGTEKSAVMREHECLVSFSERETFGLNVAEGLAFGMIPCLTPLPAYRECFGGTAVIAEDHCVTSLAKALITASRHASTPRDRREYFLSRFSESRFISALEHELAFPADKPTDEKKRPRLAL
jgi:hypothetical protein